MVNSIAEVGQGLLMTFTQKEILWIGRQFEGLFPETKKLIIHGWIILSCKTEGSSYVSFGSGICKGTADHFNKRSLVNSDVFATTALYLLVLPCKAIFFGDFFLVTTQNLAWADFIVLPKFIFTGCATNN
jgi:hypothetical protein